MLNFSQLSEEGRKSFEKIKTLNREELLDKTDKLQPWNGLPHIFFTESLDDLIEKLDIIYGQDSSILNSYTVIIVQVLNTQLKLMVNYFSDFYKDSSQKNFDRVYQSVEDLRTRIQQFGIIQDRVLGDSIQERSKMIDDELVKLMNSKFEIEELKDRVSSLVSPAVAGSLSQSFSSRIQKLKNHQLRWYWFSIVMALLAIGATTYIVSSIVGIFSDQKIADLLNNISKSHSWIVWLTIGLRVGILFPIYSIFVFCFLQYKQERYFEEEYAHKAAVANSLPNYVGLALGNDVKDQILSDSSRVIYNSPMSIKCKSNNKGDQGGNLSMLNDLLSNLQNLITKTAK